MTNINLADLLKLAPAPRAILDLQRYLESVAALTAAPDADMTARGDELLTRIAGLLMAPAPRDIWPAGQAPAAPIKRDRSKPALGQCTRDISKQLPSPTNMEDWLQRKQIEKRLRWDRKPPSFWTALEIKGLLTPYQRRNSTSGTVFYPRQEAETYIADAKDAQR